MSWFCFASCRTGGLKDEDEGTATAPGSTARSEKELATQRMLGPASSTSAGTASNPYDIAPEGAWFKNRDDFEELLVLGRGAFAKIVLARHRTNGKYYAIKIVDKKNILKQKREKDAKAERDVLMKVHHPNLLQLHGTFQSSHKLFFVMDFYPGGDLEDYIRTQQSSNLDFETARLYAAEVFLALRHLHRNKVIYRDLKPENILLTANGHLVLADFGLSKDCGIDGDSSGIDSVDDEPMDRMTATSFVGSPMYVAPEVLRKEKYTEAVDFWSYGILLFRMIYGRPPFMGKNLKEVFDYIQNEDFRFPPRPASAGALPRIERDVRDLITGLLTKDAEKRFRAEDVAKHPFFNGITFENVEAQTTHPRHWKTPDSAQTRVEKHQAKLSNFSASASNGSSSPQTPGGLSSSAQQQNVMHTPADELHKQLTQEQQKPFTQFSCNEQNYQQRQSSSAEAQ